jgi:hypothetical protein
LVRLLKRGVAHTTLLNLKEREDKLGKSDLVYTYSLGTQYKILRCKKSLD